MNPGLYGFPRNAGRQRLPFRLLDVTGLPDMPGDVRVFAQSHLRTDAGAALPGVWRPVDGTNDASVSVERGCLVVSHAAMAGPTTDGAAAHTLVHGDFDVVLVLCCEPANAFPSGNSETFAMGAYVAVEDGGRGICAWCADSEVDSDTAPVITHDTFVAPFNFDPTAAALTLGPGTAARLPRWPLTAPLFVRLKRIGAAIRVYASLDGFSWWEPDGGVSRLSDLNASAPATIGVAITSQMATPAGTFRVRVPTLKFLDPSTAFLS